MDSARLLVDTAEALAHPTRVATSGSQIRDGLVAPPRGSSPISEYVVRFLEWVGYTPTFLPTKQDLSQEFVRGLTLSLNLALNHLIATGSAFSQVLSHVRVVEQACLETYEGSH